MTNAVRIKINKIVILKSSNTVQGLECKMDIGNNMIIKTKLCVPAISRNIVNRGNIVKKLKNIFDYKITLITAPAGFGKTTTAASFLSASGIPYAWFSIDEGDNDPVRFWRYIMAAVEGISNSFSNSSVEIPVNRELALSNIFVGLFIDKLYSIPGNIVLVLDDFHLIHNELVQRSLAYFIKYMPSNFRIILLSRTEPAGELLGINATGQVLRLGVGELSFDFEETGNYFKQQGFELTPEEVAIIKDYTEGWAAGLVVISFAMEESKDVHETIKRFSGSNCRVDSYLRDEVFNQWPTEIKDFLICISILDKFTGSLCQAVTGNPDSAEILIGLAAGNSFIFHLDQDNEWFRYHHLFAEFLQNRLAREGQALLKQLHRQAGDWYQENGFMREAIISFLKAGVYEKAFPLLLDIYLSMVQQSEFSTWLDWMSSVPEEYYEREVRACTGCSWVLSMENRLEEAEVWADKAQASFDRIKDELNQSEKEFLAANVSMTKGNIGIHQMNPSQVAYYFQEADTFEVYQHIVIGEMNSGEPNLLKTAYGFKGRMKKADEAYGSVIEDLPRLIGNFSAYFTLVMAECHYERNNLESAYKIMIQSIENVLELSNSGVIVPYFITLARIKRAKGDMEGAFEAIVEGKKKLRVKSKAFWNYYFDVFTAGLYIDLQNAREVEKWLDTRRISIFDSLSCSREFEYLVFARYLNLVGRYEDALLLLNRLEAYAQKESRLGSRIEMLCLTAESYNLKGDTANAMLALDKALELGLEDGYTRTFVDQLEPMVELLIQYRNWKKKSGIDSKYHYARGLFRLTLENIQVLRKNVLLKGCISTGRVIDGGQLSSREYKVLQLLAAERSNKEIAAELCITVRTVKHHNSQIFEKLGVKNRMEAIKRAKELGLLY